MVKFIDVDPKDINTNREGRRGRVSYPILKTFLETRKKCVIIDRTGMQQSFQALYSMLGSYIKSHNLPIKLFSSRGDLYLMRLDIDDEGKEIPDWKKSATTEGVEATEEHLEARPINIEEVAKRAAEEKDKVTK